MCRLTRGLSDSCVPDILDRKVLNARAKRCDSKPGLERPAMIVVVAVGQRQGQPQEGK